jgi:hypothetical protein
MEIWSMKRYFQNLSTSGLALALLFGARSASAGVTTYPDFPSWSAAVTGVTTVTIPDPAPLPDIFIGSGTASVSYGGLTFSTSANLSNGNFFNVGVLFSGDPAVLSSQEQTVGVPNIMIAFPNPITAFALNYGTFNGSDVTFALSNGDSITQGSTGSGYAVPNFVGATDTTSFTSVLITTPDAVLNLNNVSYGAAVAVVPEPATLSLISIGIPGIVVGYRLLRKKRAA